MDTTTKAVVDGLFNRLESLSTYGHPGWHESTRHRDQINSVRYRIMDIVARTYEEVHLPDAVAYVHDHTIYRIDFIEGSLKPIGEMIRQMPDESDLMPILEAV